jgi:hypothetical protein
MWWIQQVVCKAAIAGAIIPVMEGNYKQLVDDGAERRGMGFPGSIIVRGFGVGYRSILTATGSQDGDRSEVGAYYESTLMALW